MSIQTSAIPLESWPYDDGLGDPWWQGAAGRPYRWEITMTVTEQTHGSHLTREPFKYNGLDVNVGDWVADVQTATTLLIKQISNKTETSITCIVEDVDRYNTFLNQFGNGIFTTPVQGVIFEINDDDLPVLNPLPASISQVDFAPQVESRFLTNNPVFSYRLEQIGHNFAVNDSIWINPSTGNFEKVAGINVVNMIGTVNSIGPGPNLFYIRPTTKIIEDINPILPGQKGDIIYVDENTSQLTTTVSDKKAFIQISNSTPDTAIGNITTPTVTSGDVLEINKINVTFTGTTLAQTIIDINALQSSHSVVASSVSSDTQAVTNSGDLAYGIVGCQGTATQATINSILVSFNIDTSGQINFGSSVADSIDMAQAINNTSIPDIVADGGSGGPAGVLTITNTSGGAITIVNVTNDIAATPFAGPGSCSGVQLVTSTSSQNFIKLTNNFGTGIIIKDIVGTPRFDLGIASSKNGAIPFGLIVEQSVTQSISGVIVYPNLAARPATAGVGDQAMILDNGNGEWALYLYDGTQWTEFANQDSANTDANSLQLTLSATSSAAEVIGVISSNSRVSLITIDVTVPFDGAPVLTIGDDIIADRLMNNSLHDLSTAGVYSSSSDYLYASGFDTAIKAYFTPNGATTGTAILTISYL